MFDSVRQYLAMVVVGVASAALAMAVLLIVRVVQPGSTVVERGLVPRPLSWLAGWARSRTMRLWTDDDEVRATLEAHWCGSDGRRLSRVGVVMAAAPADADTLVVTGKELAPPDHRGVLAEPFRTVVVVDPSDAAELIEVGRLAAVDARIDPRMDAMPDFLPDTTAGSDTPGGRR